jgi:hypothetical protein
LARWQWRKGTGFPFGRTCQALKGADRHYLFVKKGKGKCHTEAQGATDLIWKKVFETDWNFGRGTVFSKGRRLLQHESSKTGWGGKIKKLHTSSKEFPPP